MTVPGRVLLMLTGMAAIGAEAPPGMARIPAGDLRVTEGKLLPGPDGAIRIAASKVRAVARRASGATAALRIVYLGPSPEQKPLQSGEMREQVGLKLNAEDGCNVLYAMWRIRPKPGVVVSLKRNPDEHSSGECGNSGYTNLRPRRGSPAPLLRPGEPHLLRSEQRGEELRVFVDDTMVWEGPLPPEALSLRGPVGFRTDNGSFDLELFAPL